MLSDIIEFFGELFMAIVAIVFVILAIIGGIYVIYLFAEFVIQSTR